MRTVYDYDRARRLKEIRHERYCNGNWTTALRLNYVLTADGLIDGYTEIDGGDDCSGSPVTSTVDFRYDHRNRLVEESRTGAHAYAVAYTYDQGGNRLSKTSGSTTVTYEYDLDDPGTNGSFNNRLMGYEIRNSQDELVRRVDFAYDLAGHASYMLVADAGEGPWRTGYGFSYDHEGRVWMAVKDRFQLTAEGTIVPGSFNRVAASEYLYAGDWGYETGLLAVEPEQELAPPSAGWQHVGERWYDPATGRFLQSDSIGIAGGLNRYAYVENNPVFDLDFDGTKKLKDRLKDAERKIIEWGKRACSIARKIAIDRTGTSARPLVPISIIGPPAAALEAAPDVVRIYCAKKHFSNSVEGGVTAEEALDFFEQGHSTYVKPARR